MRQSPVPSFGDVLVKVHATSVSTAEITWYDSMNWANKDGAPRSFPVIPGHDFSGSVAQMGEGVVGINEGDEVYGLLDFYRNGARQNMSLLFQSRSRPNPGPRHMLKRQRFPCQG
ncbi:MAG TPA: alcohol dehydrogenase catalytic domain-containing protein [Nitrososphaerales archaeon]|nr:alcohol dehydrogenase catalytic domain-containing protein [Nitrososphaerales archaeon]